MNQAPMFADHYTRSTGPGALKAFSQPTIEALLGIAQQIFQVMPEQGRVIRTDTVDAATTAGGAAQPHTVLTLLNRDRPFLVDSIMGEIQARGLTVSLVAHPTFKTHRNSDGTLDAILAPGDNDWAQNQESLIQVVTDQIDDIALADLKHAIGEILHGIDQVVADWPTMRQRIDDVASLYARISPPSVDPEELAEARAFLEWLSGGNFVFLGTREYRVPDGASASSAEPRIHEGFGILSDPEVRVLRRGAEFVEMTPEVRRFYLLPSPLITTKSNVVAKINRRVHMDYIGAKLYADDGSFAGELRIIGLFTSSAYTQSVVQIPLLRRRAQGVAKILGFAEGSHSSSALRNMIETFPRDELMQMSHEQLAEWASGILDLNLRPRTRVFARRDEFDRFVSVLAYLPRDRYTTEKREQISEYLAKVFKGRLSAFVPHFSQGPLVRVQFVIGRYEGETPDVPSEELERAIDHIVRDWDDALREALAASELDQTTAARYSDAFSVGYKSDYPPVRAVVDAREMEKLTDENPTGIHVYRRTGAPDTRARVALYRIDQPIPLSKRVPFFENLGFAVIDERSYALKPGGAEGEHEVQLHDMRLEDQGGAPMDVDAHRDRLESAFQAVWTGQAHDDHFNRLIRQASITWREVVVARAYGAYLRQLNVTYGLRYISDTLVRHSEITRNLFAMFHTRFDPDNGLSNEERAAEEKRLADLILEALTNVPSLDEDRIIRHYVNLIRTTLRTNFYRRTTDGDAPETLSFKLDSANVDGSPHPRPYREIYIYSPRVEGIHLRSGPVARGGLRWSDRPQDFRTEVLGLAKAQQVKNAVIVPAGAKGGFVPKKLPQSGSRDEILAEGVAAYSIFISSLLDITDNLDGDDIIAPECVVRHDGDDPYLVVAADKGTATFSDTANGIADKHGFWMSDAFASGGSAGYDHKKMGITAGGAWEAVKRHFREMNHDIQSTPFTALGIGDMSGDVFGNGMLLSRATRLVAAFDHRDIFIDPDPDITTSYAERERLFALPRSSWQDYDKSLISQGGGVFSRAAKEISLSPEIKALAGLKSDTTTPNELMRALLRADVDLLWMGGIGTYIRASTESDLDVGDPNNDAIRVTARELGAKVVGEGANLGLTQAARIEFALAGGRINTDAIDNSAGVNSSDQEVNIKIALRPAVREGAISMEERNALLEEMTDAVGESCLRNNYLQSLVLSLGERHAMSDFGFQTRLIRELETSGLLNPTLEGLPDAGGLVERNQAQIPLTRPELAVLLGYSKIDLFARLLQSSVPDDPYLEDVLRDYFPERMREAFADGIASHRLRRDIIATSLTNDVINRGGSTVVVRLAEETGHDAADIVYAFAGVRNVYRLDPLWQRIDALDNKVDGDVQLDLYLDVQQLVRRKMAWFLRHFDFSEGLEQLTERFRPGVDAYRQTILEAMQNGTGNPIARHMTAYVERGVPDDVARDVALLDVLFSAPDVTLIARQVEVDVDAAIEPFRAADAALRLGDLRQAGESIDATDYFDRLAINSALNVVGDAHRTVTESVLMSNGNGNEKGRFDVWQEQNAAGLARLRRKMDEILDGSTLSVARLTVAASHVRDFAHTTGQPGGRSGGDA